MDQNLNPSQPPHEPSFTPPQPGGMISPTGPAPVLTPEPAPTPATPEPVAATTPVPQRPAPMLHAQPVVGDLAPQPDGQKPVIPPPPPPTTTNPGMTYDYSVPFGPSQPFSPVKKPSRKKLVLPIMAFVVVLLLSSGGFVFGYYLPNKPENVWKTGLGRSGKVLDKIVVDSTQKSTLMPTKSLNSREMLMPSTLVVATRST